MGKIKETLHWLCKLLFGGSLYLLGGWSKTLGAMLIFIIVDYISGYLKSVYKKDLSSKIAFKGLIKKTACILAVIIAASLDRLIEETGVSYVITIFNVNLTFRNMIIFSIIGNEGISIIENLTELGVPFTKAFTKFFKQLKQQNEQDKDNK